MNVVECLRASAARFPGKTAFIEPNASITYAEFIDACERVAGLLAERGCERANVGIFMESSINTLTCMFGCAMANACYAVIDAASPEGRLNAILGTLQPTLVLTDEKHAAALEAGAVQTVLVGEARAHAPAAPETLAAIDARRTADDALYILFTSGSTGVPKGVVLGHGAVVAYARAACRTFGIDGSIVWGSQAAFHFSLCILDLFTAIVAGGTLAIIPKFMFTFPKTLVEYLNACKANAIYWVPTAFSMLANFKVFDVVKPECLTRAYFVGEVMPARTLQTWMEALPDCEFANLYGPTELTDTCTYYRLPQGFDAFDSIPIGRAYDECTLYVVDAQGRLVTPEACAHLLAAGASLKDLPFGELHVGGDFLAFGYYRDAEKTARAFVEGPQRADGTRERVYRTGDLVTFDGNGDLRYLGRADFQIKHAGYRIELGEIEATVGAFSEVAVCACAFADDTIHLFYQCAPGESLDEAAMKRRCKQALPSYMRPGGIHPMRRIPVNSNGKIDRQALKTLIAAL